MGHDRGTAVITGGGSLRGIGRAVGRRLASEGYSVAILDLDRESAERTAAECRDLGGAAIGLQCDVIDLASIDVAAAVIERELPAVTVLANIAGVSAPTPFAEIAASEWNRVFAVNVNGTVLMTQRFLPGMRQRRYGRVVNMSSVSAQRGGGIFGASHYSASKAAVLGLTKALAREVARDGVTVNAVAPSMVDTDIAGGHMSDVRKKELAEGTLIGRLASTADVAFAISFLASPEAEYITGATLDVNGGSHLH